ncbi:MAG: FtsX-like permease family protein [Caldilineaceae bacterium]
MASIPGPRPICNRWKRCATKAAAGQAKGILARWQPKFPQPLAAARTLISASGIGIGVATLVMLGGLVDGLIGELNSLAGSGGAGNITVMQRDVADMSLSSLDERVARAIQAMPQVEAASPFVLGFVMSKEMPLFIIAGLDPNSPAMRHYSLVQGRYMVRPNEIVIGKIAAETYDLGVGDTMQLYENRYKVVGISETGVSYEDGGGLLALSEAQRLMGKPRSVSFIFVDVKDPSQAELVVEVINKRFPEARASLSSTFAQNTNDIASTMAMTNAIRLLALIVGGIVVANTMIMSIYERTREIGTLRAVGWARRRILGQILQESVYLCLFAGVLGALVGVVLLTLLSLPASMSQFIAPTWHARTFIMALSVALALGVIGGLYPAWRASKLRPVEALRYE